MRTVRQTIGVDQGAKGAVARPEGAGACLRGTGGRLVFFSVLVVLLMLALSGSVAAISPEVFETSTLTANDGNDSNAGVSGDRVVWSGYEDGDSEIYTWTPADGVFQISVNTDVDDYPQVSGDRVVWQGNDGSDYEIFTWTPTDGLTQLTDNAYEDAIPQVSGDRVVWLGNDGSDDEIFTWTPTDGVTQLTDNAQYDGSPRVSGDRVVWYGTVDADYEIFTWTPTDGVTQLTDNAYEDVSPEVSGDRVVWWGHDGSDYEAFTWTPTDGVTQLSDNGYDDYSPRISGDRVVWYGGDGADDEIFTWTPTDGVTQLTDNSYDDRDPDVSGDRVVWIGSDGSDWEVFTWTSSKGTTQVTSNDYWDGGPRVSGDRTVWLGNDGSDDEVCTAIPTPVLVTGLSPAVGSESGGTEVTVYGRGFTGATSVTFGGIEATSFTEVSDTEITAASPPGMGTVQVQVVSPLGTSPDTAADDFTYEVTLVPEVFETTAVPGSENGVGVGVSGDRLVWEAYDPIDYDDEIYTWTPADGTTPVTNNGPGYDDEYPRVSGDRVVWSGYDGDDWEIYTRVAGEAAVQISDNDFDDFDAQVSGDFVVWKSWDGNDDEIVVWFFNGGDPLTIQLTANDSDDRDPQVSGDRVVWYGFDGDGYEIFTWVYNSGSPVSTQLTDGSLSVYNPQVSGDRVVWQTYDYEDYDYEIFTWAVGDPGNTQLTSNSDNDENPKVSGDRVVWRSYDGNDYEIFTWTPAVGTTRLTDNDNDDQDAQVSGDRVVWTGYDGNDDEIFTWSRTGGTTQLTDDHNYDYGPQVDGDRLAWRGYNEEIWNYQVYTAVLAPVAVTGLDPSAGPIAGDTEVTITGYGFTDATSVTFGGTPAADWDVVSDTEMWAETPAHAGGVVQVQVTTPLGASPDVAADDFEFLLPPPEIFIATQLTDNFFDDHEPQADGDLVVWEADNGDTYGDIFGWWPALGGAEQALTSGDGWYNGPRVSDGRVVWGGDVADIYTWTEAGGASTFYASANADYSPQISGDRLVWTTWDGIDYEIMTMQVGDSVPTQITDDGYHDTDPQVSGDHVVWCKYDGNDHEIFAWTAGDTEPTQLTDDYYYAYDPQVSGDRVVWEQEDGNDYEIFTWVFGDPDFTQLTDDGSDDSDPQVSGDRVVWWGYQGEPYYGSGVFTWTPGEGVGQISGMNTGVYNPQVSGDRVVWQGWDQDYNDEEIFTWTPASGQATQVTDNDFTDQLPVVSGDRIAWEGADGDSYEIFTALIAPVAVTSVSPDYGQVDGGTEVTITGYGFTGATSVTFGGYSAADVVVVDDTEITATSPLNSAGTVQVQVVAPLGTSPDTPLDDFSYYSGAPAIYSVDPVQGPSSDWREVVISGGDFVNVTAVTFGDQDASYTVDSTNQITAVAPYPSTAGYVQVRVTGAGGISETGPYSAYRYVDNPVITNLDVTSGPWEGGPEVVISGDNFVAVENLYFGGARVDTFEVDSEQSIRAELPAWWWGGAVEVNIQAAGGWAAYSDYDEFTYTQPVPAEAFAKSQLTDTAADEQDPRLDGNRIVWQASDGEDNEIFTWTTAGGVVQVTDNAIDDNDPQVSGQRLVWEVGDDGGRIEIATWTPGDGVDVISESAYNSFDPQVSGDRVVWKGDDGNDAEIYSWTPQGGVVQITDDDCEDEDPQVSGDRIVWTQWDGGDSDIFTYTPTGGIEPCSTGGYDYAPQVSGDRVVWMNGEYMSEQVYTWTPTEPEAQISAGGSAAWDPQVSGERVVWWSPGGADGNKVYTWTASSGVVVDLTPSGCNGEEPQVSGDRVVWCGQDGNDGEVVTWTPQAGLSRITDDDPEDWEAVVSGDRIAWVSDDESYLNEVFTAVIAAPTVTGLDVISGPSIGGTEVVITGTNFVGVTDVTFGGTAATTYTVDSLTQITATAPAHAIGSVQVQLTNAGGASTDNGTLDDFLYLAPTTVQQSDARITYLGTWGYAAQAGASGGSFNYTTSSNAAALISFQGTSLGLLAKTAFNYGIAYVSLDGAAEVAVDFYSATPVYQKPVYVTGDLVAGEHTLTIRFGGTKNDDSTGYLVDLDALQVMGTITQADKPERRQETDANFTYSGSWSTSWTWSASGGSFKYAGSPGSAVNVAFDGTYLAWYAKKGPGYGKAQVSLDGGTPVLVDLYSSYYQYKQRVYETGLLADGPHTLSVYWINQMNPASRGTSITVDTFDILGTVTAAPEPPPILWRYQQGDTRLTFLGSWSYGATWSASGGSFYSTGEKGAAVVVNFTGTSVSLLARTTPWYGIAYLSLDGAAAVPVDFYSSSTLYKQSVHSWTGLEPGLHTLTIECAREKRPSSSDYGICIDALDITGTLTQALAPTRYQQDDSHLNYEGSWSRSWTWSASGGTFDYVNSPGARLTAGFDGTYLAWVAKTGPNYGRASVVVDGGPAVTVDLYSPGTVYKKVVFNTGLLDPGIHTVVIQWLGTRSPAATGTLIDVDTFDVLGTLVTPSS